MWSLIVMMCLNPNPAIGEHPQCVVLKNNTQYIGKMACEAKVPEMLDGLREVYGGADPKFIKPECVSDGERV